MNVRAQRRCAPTRSSSACNIVREMPGRFTHRAKTSWVRGWSDAKNAEPADGFGSGREPERPPRFSLHQSSQHVFRKSAAARDSMRRRSHSLKAPKETGLQKLFTFDSNGRNGSRHFRRTLHSCMISLPSGRGRPVPPSGRPALIPHFPRSLRWRNVHVVEVTGAGGAIVNVGLTAHRLARAGTTTPPRRWHRWSCRCRGGC